MMVGMPLPHAYRWSDSSDGSCRLYWNYGFVASVAPDGATKIKLWDKSEIQSKAASVAQAKRFIERWLLAQRSDRARDCARWRARYSKPARALIPKRKEYVDVSLFTKPAGRRSESGDLCSRLAKMPEPDDF